MDDWSFPRGTKLWKEFSWGGRRVETRYLERIGDGPRDWVAVSYVWRDDQSDALMAPAGADAVAGHDVPAAGKCNACHAGRRSYVLGFSAVQLSAPKQGTDVDLEALVREGSLSNPPSRTIAVPANEKERQALGYLHANCGNCHNQSRPPRAGARCYDPQRPYDFWLQVDRLGSPDATPTYTTAIPATVQAGDPDDSRLVKVMSRRGGLALHMPPLGSDEVDRRGVEVLRGWISAMRPDEHAELDSATRTIE
jgi:hypothetical protein